jgi:hypothetical protein
MTETLIHLAAAALLLVIGVYNIIDWRRKRLARPRPRRTRGPDGRFQKGRP